MPVTRAMAAAQAANKDGTVRGNSNKRPPRKRTKTKGQVTHRTKKAKLSRLLDMPPEVFNEIVPHLLPMDLLSLARSNKFFRKMFMSRTSRHFWKSALGNQPNLPPCPPHLSEPNYVSLLFSKTCSNCGIRVLRRMDPYLYVRLCNSCRDEDLMEMSVLNPLLQYLPKSDVIGQPRPGSVYTLKSEFSKIRSAADQNEEAFMKWQEDKFVEQKERYARSVELEDYLDMMEDERIMELGDLKVQREIEIKARLIEEGWAKRDMEPSPSNAAQWNKLVWQPKPITDRIWTNLYPKLQPLLESNKAYNDQFDKDTRRRARIKKLQGLVGSIRIALPPLVQLTQESTPQEDNAESSTSLDHFLFTSKPPDIKFDQPFPSMAELLTWPMIKNIIDDDTSPEDAGTRFEEIRGEFDEAVVEWREKVEQDLVDIWNAGRDEDEDEGKSTRKGKGKAVPRTSKTNTRKSKGRKSATTESTTEAASFNLPNFVLTFTKPDGTTTTNLSDLSPNLQLLLRADTVFKSTKYVSDHTYPGIVPRAAPYGIIVGGSDELIYGERWDTSAIQRDNEASSITKVMLALVGRPDVTSVEMKALGGNFLCGRCNRTLTDTWDHLQAREKIKVEPSAGFVYNSTHDIEPGNPKPFAQLLTPQAAIDYEMDNSDYATVMMTCMRCEKMGIQAQYLHAHDPEFNSPLKEHLHDVHGVVEPRAGMDFRRWENDIGFFDPLEFDEDDYESDEEMWGFLN